jgi:hypothetical protein
VVSTSEGDGRKSAKTHRDGKYCGNDKLDGNVFPGHGAKLALTYPYEPVTTFA